MNYQNDHLWKKIFYIQTSGLWIGINEAGEWIYESQLKKIKLLKDTPCIPCLPCLETDLDMLKTHLANSISLLNLDEIIRGFPYDSIVITGLTSKSDYWISLSLGWILKMEMTSIIADILNTIKSDTYLSQKTHHKVLKTLSIWKRRQEKIIIKTND